jgi:hypothetical protein
LIRDHSHQFKLASKRFEEQIVTRQCAQAELSDSAMWLHAWACTLSAIDRDVRKGVRGAEFAQRWSAAMHFFDMAENEIKECFRRLALDDDGQMVRCAKFAMEFADTLPNSDYVIHEASPNSRGTGKPPARAGIRAFPGDNASPTGVRASARMSSDEESNMRAEARTPTDA